MIMESTLTILEYSPEHRSSIRKILTKIGWAEGYISAMEGALNVFSTDLEIYGIYLALSNGEVVGYIMPRYYEDGLDGVTYQKFFDR